MRSIASSSSGPGGAPPRRYSSAKPWIEVSGVRSSCEASARNWRSRCSEAVRAAISCSMRTSMVFSAAPSRPDSVCGSASSTRRDRSPPAISAAACSIRVSGRRPIRTTDAAPRPSSNRTIAETAMSIIRSGSDRGRHLVQRYRRGDVPAASPARPPRSPRHEPSLPSTVYGRPVAACALIEPGSPRSGAVRAGARRAEARPGGEQRGVRVELVQPRVRAEAQPATRALLRVGRAVHLPDGGAPRHPGAGGPPGGPGTSGAPRSRPGPRRPGPDRPGPRSPPPSGSAASSAATAGVPIVTRRRYAASRSAYPTPRTVWISGGSNLSILRRR